ncbi:MAG: hypothetical protein E5W53_11945 [Mesorhizobium sp.]|nr:MAG: hypothetical protein E5W53_11945 [Mesorhizobium sp.]
MSEYDQVIVLEIPVDDEARGELVAREDTSEREARFIKKKGVVGEFVRARRKFGWNLPADLDRKRGQRWVECFCLVKHSSILAA